MTTMTIGQIAERVGIPGKTFHERLRYWTREGLLIPISERYPGIGKRRRYADSAVEHALILNQMMDIGLSTAMQSLAMEAVHQEQYLGRWVRGAKPGINFFLVIDTDQDGHSQAYLHAGSAFTTSDRAERTVIIDLTKIFMRKVQVAERQQSYKIPHNKTEQKQPAGDVLLWGVKAIAGEIGLSERQTYWRLENGQLPAGKQGQIWVASRQTLRAFFQDLATENQAEKTTIYRHGSI
jgi:DNA-binding transcriptional MerR regulator